MYMPNHFIMRWLNLGFILLCITTDNQMINWWKNELILRKLSSISIEILNDVACNLSWIEKDSNLLELNSNTLIVIWIELT
jgi:hypothetical protein